MEDPKDPKDPFQTGQGYIPFSEGGAKNQTAPARKRKVSEEPVSPQQGLLTPVEVKQEFQFPPEGMGESPEMVFLEFSKNCYQCHRPISQVTGPYVHTQCIGRWNARFDQGTVSCHAPGCHFTPMVDRQMGKKFSLPYCAIHEEYNRRLLVGKYYAIRNSYRQVSENHSHARRDLEQMRAENDRLRKDRDHYRRKSRQPSQPPTRKRSQSPRNKRSKSEKLAKLLDLLE